MKCVIEKLTSDHKLLNFNCGDNEINTYFYENALKDVESRNSQIYVFLNESKQMIGFYALSMSSIRIKYEGTERTWPVSLLGQLGVNISFQKKGWGQILIQNAIYKVDQLSREIGCIGLILHTYNPELSKNFYQKALNFELIRSDQIKGKTQSRILLCYLLKNYVV